MTRIDHVGLVVGDVDLAKAFYSAAFVLDADSHTIEAVRHGGGS